MPDPYGTPGSYRAPEPYRPPGSHRSSEPGPPSGSYRVPGYYRTSETSVESQPYQAPEAQQTAEPYSAASSGSGSSSYSDESYSDESYTGESYTGDSYSSHDEPEPYEPPEPPSSSYEAPEPYEPPSSSYDTPEPYDAPEPYEAPEEPSAGDYGALGHYGETPDEPDPAPKGTTGEEDFADFWREERRGGGLHSSRTSPAKNGGTTGPPGLPGDVPRSQPNPARRQVLFLGGVLVILVAAGVIAAILLLSHHGKPRPAAGGSPATSAPSHHPSTSPSASSTGPPPPPAVTGASGRLGVPKAIGSLKLNPALTTKFASALAKQIANSFFIPNRDVVSGFYTTDPSATTFTAKDQRLMFTVAYLAGSGNAKSSLHAFMTNATFTSQQQISPGRLGGVAACALLPQKTAAPVTHCMWADGNTYADFYAWGSTPSALARTMIGIRPQVELKRH